MWGCGRGVERTRAWVALRGATASTGEEPLRAIGCRGSFRCVSLEGGKCAENACAGSRKKIIETDFKIGEKIQQSRFLRSSLARPLVLRAISVSIQVFKSLRSLDCLKSSARSPKRKGEPTVRQCRFGEILWCDVLWVEIQRYDWLEKSPYR